MLAEEKNLDAVLIATPDFWHARHTVACLEAGLHVLCEKMMARDVEGLRRMLETGRRTGRLLEIGHQRHYNPVFLAAYEGIIKPGLLGEIYYSRLAVMRVDRTEGGRFRCGVKFLNLSARNIVIIEQYVKSRLKR